MTRRRLDESEVEREMAFRRGYVDGVQVMISAIVDRLSKAERQDFKSWFANVLKPWSSQATGNALPPQPPRLY